MKYIRSFSVCLLAPLVLFVLSCAGVKGVSTAGDTTAAPRPDQAEMDTSPYSATDFSARTQMVFIPAEFPSLDAATGVGLITTERRDRAASLNEDERTFLSGSFRDAYIDSLFRGLPLAGVLGGDLVHGWPAGNPSAWVQNWRSSEPEANSWGLPPLVLAVQGIAASIPEAGPLKGRVFTVYGKILDHYGKSAGIDGANGSTGYGPPRGCEFFYEGNIAQRFDLGLISVDREGKDVFLPGDPPSLGAEAPSDTGVFSSLPAASRGEIRSAFLGAWEMALDRGVEMVPDGPGTYLSLSGSSFRDSPGGNSIAGFYIQSFNNKSALLVLPDSDHLPPYPRFIGAPFLEALLSSANYPVPGGENLKAEAPELSGGDDFSRALIKGFALYGIPLSDPLPLKTGDSSGPWREAQRFSRGWLCVNLGAGS